MLCCLEGNRMTSHIDTISKADWIQLKSYLGPQLTKYLRPRGRSPSNVGLKKASKVSLYFIEANSSHEEVLTMQIDQVVVMCKTIHIPDMIKRLYILHTILSGKYKNDRHSD